MFDELSVAKDSNEEEFDAVRKEINDNSRVLNDILVTLNHMPLTVEEMFKLQDQTVQQGLKAQQYHDAVMSKLDHLELMLKVVGDSVLTQQEVQQRTKYLKALLIAAEDVVLTDRIIGQGGLVIARYKDSTDVESV